MIDCHHPLLSNLALSSIVSENSLECTDFHSIVITSLGIAYLALTVAIPPSYSHLSLSIYWLATLQRLSPLYVYDREKGVTFHEGRVKINVWLWLGRSCKEADLLALDSGFAPFSGWRGSLRDSVTLKSMSHEICTSVVSILVIESFRPDSLLNLSIKLCLWQIGNFFLAFVFVSNCTLWPFTENALSLISYWILCFMKSTVSFPQLD